MADYARYKILDNNISLYMSRRGGLSEIEMSRMTNISPRSIHRYKFNKAQPSIENAFKLARALECRVEDLFNFGPEN